MQPDDSSDWLDTETRSILCAEPPALRTAVDTKAYSLLLLKAGGDENRTIEAISETQRYGSKNSTHIPIVIAQQLKLDDALTGQFALACCDCVSAFLPDEIVYDENAGYLRQLSDEVMSSPEFQLVTARVDFVPSSDRGRRFAWQFLGVAVGITLPIEIQAFRKKVRLMSHLATKCGVRMEVVTG